MDTWVTLVIIVIAVMLVVAVGVGISWFRRKSGHTAGGQKKRQLFRRQSKSTITGNDTVILFPSPAPGSLPLFPPPPVTATPLPDPLSSYKETTGVPQQQQLTSTTDQAQRSETEEAEMKATSPAKSESPKPVREFDLLPAQTASSDATDGSGFHSSTDASGSTTSRSTVVSQDSTFDPDQATKSAATTAVSRKSSNSGTGGEDGTEVEVEVVASDQMTVEEAGGGLPAEAPVPPVQTSDTGAGSVADETRRQHTSPVPSVAATASIGSSTINQMLGHHEKDNDSTEDCEYCQKEKAAV